jgi:hypothetical protein
MNTKSYIKLTGIMLLVILAGRVFAQQPAIQYMRYYDQRGINVFETTKTDTIPYEGFKVRFGAGFTQGYQNISHSNKAKAVLPVSTSVTYIETAPGSGSFVNRVTGAPVVDVIEKDPNVFGGYINTNTFARYTNSNQVYEMSGGFPLAQANLNIDVQIADGVTLNLVSYMSSHHHNEFWVKGGYFQIDKVGFMNSAFMDKIWKNVTLKVGHMEVNYGDQHFRRSDGGHTLWNPFMENYIMDAFTTEIGAELYYKYNGFIGMIAMTDGEIQGNVTKPEDRAPSIYGKLGFDKNLQDNLRVRLTGSFYTTKSSVSNTIYGGDRTGSNYQYVIENTAATLTANAFSGRFNPGYRDNVTAFMVNPFLKVGGFEFFGTYESAKGNSALENGEVLYSNDALNVDRNGDPFRKLDERQTTQIAGDVLYRFGKRENFYVGVRYNKVDSELRFGQGTSQATNIDQLGTLKDVTITRTAVAAGWFITKNVLFKAEYVTQQYDGFPVAFTNYAVAGGYQDSSIFHKAKFDGFVIQGVISF